MSGTMFSCCGVESILGRMHGYSNLDNLHVNPYFQLPIVGPMPFYDETDLYNRQQAYTRVASAAAAAAAAAAQARMELLQRNDDQEDCHRKRKSRDAARTRRSKENEQFGELAKLLPLPAAITGQLDKASIVRLAASYLQLRHLYEASSSSPDRDNQTAHSGSSSHDQQTQRPHGLKECFENQFSVRLLQSLDAFAFVLSITDGKILYISETVTSNLGLSQVELIGRRFVDYVHRHDQEEFLEQMGLRSGNTGSSRQTVPSNSPTNETNESTSPSSQATPYSSRISNKENVNVTQPRDRAFCVRMKSTLCRRGSQQKYLGYKVVQIITRVKPCSGKSENIISKVTLCGLALALPSPSLSELPLDRNIFVTRMTSAFDITFCEPRISKLTDISSEELLETNLYDACHAADLMRLQSAHQELLVKGQVQTEYYRLMNRSGGFVWVQTCACLLRNPKNQEQNIVATNYVLSRVQQPQIVMSIQQMAKVQQPPDVHQMANKHQQDIRQMADDGSITETNSDIDDNSKQRGGSDDTSGESHEESTDMRQIQTDDCSLSSESLEFKSHQSRFDDCIHPHQLDECIHPHGCSDCLHPLIFDDSSLTKGLKRRGQVESRGADDREFHGEWKRVKMHRPWNNNGGLNQTMNNVNGLRREDDCSMQWRREDGS